VRRLLTFAVTLAALAGGLVGLMSLPAYGDTVCGQTDPATGECLIWIEVPGNPGNPGDPGEPGDDGPKDTGSGAACYWDGTDQGITKPPPGPVPCSSQFGDSSGSCGSQEQVEDRKPCW
jgi:hypothetical protein